MNSIPTSGSSSALLNEREIVREAGRSAISSFLDTHTCFQVLRASGKVVVFDTRIPIQLAFYALVEHDMQAAPLWDPSIRQFVGLLTVTDFIDILRYFRRTSNSTPNNSNSSSSGVSTLATRSIAQILLDPELSSLLKHKTFYAADSSTSLKHACVMLNENGIDFLPIMLPEDMRVLSNVTYTNVLEHLVTHFREQRRLFDDTIYDLGIGTYQNIITVTPTHTLAETLHLLQQHNLSAVPVVDPNQNNRVIDVYSRSDITFLAAATDAEDAIRNLDLTLGDILAQQRQDVTTPDRLHTCSVHHTLQTIFEYFAQLKFNRLIVADEQGRCVGVVSARDLVAYFVSDEKNKNNNNKSTQQQQQRQAVGVGVAPQQTSGGAVEAGIQTQ